MKLMEVAGNPEFERLLDEVVHEDIVLTRKGVVVALLSDFDQDDLEWYPLEHDPEFIESLKRAREEVKAGKCVSLEQLEREFGIERE